MEHRRDANPLSLLDKTSHAVREATIGREALDDVVSKAIVQGSLMSIEAPGFARITKANCALRKELAKSLADGIDQDLMFDGEGTRDMV